MSSLFEESYFCGCKTQITLLETKIWAKRENGGGFETQQEARRQFSGLESHSAYQNAPGVILRGSVRPFHAKNTNIIRKRFNCFKYYAHGSFL